MAVFVAYSDEAGVENPDRHFLVSGYLASAADWPWVVRAWQDRVLDGPPKLPYLHMIEIRREEWRKQQKISLNNAEERVAEAVRVLYSTGSMSAIASVIKQTDLGQVFHAKYKRKKHVPIGIDEPDYFCFLAYVAFMVGELRRMYPEAERVDFVVSEKKPLTDRLAESYKGIKEWFSEQYPDLASLLGNFRAGSMVQELPLQAADLLSWHLQRYYSGNFNRTIENRIWYLTKERDGYKHEWERSELEAMAEGLGLS